MSVRLLQNDERCARPLSLRVCERLIEWVIPRRRRLPHRFRLHLKRGAESELRHLQRYAPRGEVAVDVGANVGMYTYALAMIYPTVYAFEPNTSLTSELAAWNPGCVNVIRKGLSSSEGRATLRVPVIGGWALHGWGSLERSTYPGASHWTEMDVELARLDSFAICNVAFLKIDVEGHELQMLEGARKTIADSRPMVVIEVKPGNRADVREYFSLLAYQEVRLDDLIGVPGSEENFIFIPEGD